MNNKPLSRAFALLFVCFNLALSEAITQQKSIKFGFDFDFLLDNLEESQTFLPTRTLFAGSLFPQIQINFYNQHLILGGYFINNMGESYPQKGGITLSYDFTFNAIKGYFGIFSKRNQIGSYSHLFFRKDFVFFNPVNNGIMFQYQPKDSNLMAEFIFDWYGGDRKKRFDEFFTQGFMQKNFFDKQLYFGTAFLLYHFKNDVFLNLDGKNFDTYLLDRLYYQFFIGTELQSFIPALDTLQLQFSNLSSLERKRRLSTGLDPFSNQLGWQFDFKTQYKGFGVDNALYFGDSQYKYFHQYKENFYAGLPFYQSRFYDRAEIYYEYKNAYITGRFSIIFHFTKENFSHQQMLTISLDTQKLFD